MSVILTTQAHTVFHELQLPFRFLQPETNRLSNHEGSDGAHRHRNLLSGASSGGEGGRGEGWYTGLRKLDL